METQIIGIHETSPGTFRITYNRNILGDSRGYSKADAIQKARDIVARDGGVDGNWEGCNWVEVRNILDPAL